MNRLISSGHRHFGFLHIFQVSIFLTISSIVLAILADTSGLFALKQITLFGLLALFIIPSGLLIAVNKWHYKFYVYSDRIEIFYPLKSEKKVIRLDEISYVRFNDLAYLYNPVGGVLNIYSTSNKMFTELTFYDRNSFGNKEIFHLTQFLYNSGIEIKFGKTEKEYSYYTQFFKQNAG